MIEETPSSADLQLFVRRIDIPPGAPWDQHRAAKLAAAHGAPLSRDVVAASLKRLAPWRARRPGVFAVAYIRRADLPPDGVVEGALEGKALRFAFQPAGLALARARKLAITGLLAIVAIAALGLGVQTALNRRAQNEQLLARLESNASRGERLGRRSAQRALDMRLVRLAGAEHSSFADLAADLAWLSQARRPSALIQRVTWGSAEIAVLSMGPDAPVSGSERQMESEPAAAGAREWRIRAAAPPVVRSGVVRPSVVSMVEPSLLRPRQP
jgi:hypothetical protein